MEVIYTHLLQYLILQVQMLWNSIKQTTDYGFMLYNTLLRNSIMEFVVFDLESALNVHLKHPMWILYFITQNHLKNRRYLNIPKVIFEYSIQIFKYLQTVKYSGYLNIIFHCQMWIFSAVRYKNSIYFIIILLKYPNLLFIIIQFIMVYEIFSLSLSKNLIIE